MIHLTDLKTKIYSPKKLKIINPKTPKFYITLKIHTHTQNNPGRPVINSIKWQALLTITFNL